MHRPKLWESLLFVSGILAPLLLLAVTHKYWIWAILCVAFSGLMMLWRFVVRDEQRKIFGYNYVLPGLTPVRWVGPLALLNAWFTLAQLLSLPAVLSTPLFSY